MQTLAPASTPRWPARVIVLCADLRAGGGRREAVRTEAWVLVRDALARYIRCHAGGVRHLPTEDLEDLASTKALELLTRAESGDWNPDGRHPGEVAGYLAAVARNGLMRLAEHRRRETAPGVTSVDGEVMELEQEDRSSPRTDSAAEASEFVAALRGCVEALAPRARRVWFFRAFFEMTSRDIAAHPAVGLNPAHVDVLVQRTRETLRTCLADKGLQPRDYPPGTFSALWHGLSALAETTAPAAAREDDHVR